LRRPKNTADVIIIGGGIIGTSSGYHLIKKGLKVIIFEKRYLTAGSTGRCIGGIRQQFLSETSIKIAMESVKMFSQMEEELDTSVEWYQGGYLFLAYSEDIKRQYLEAIKIQRKVGLKVDFLSGQDILRLFPYLNPEGIIGGSFCPSDGQANPFLVVKGYADNIRRHGGEIFVQTEIKKINVKNSKVEGVTTQKGEKYFAPVVLNATGPDLKETAETVGINLPVTPERHEALITEGFQRILEPMLVDYRKQGCYFNQRFKTGQFIGCYTPSPPQRGKNINSSFDFIQEMPKRMLRLIPLLKKVKVLRQWAGSYTMTPDGNPIVDETQIKGLYIAGGMCGHGFMFGPYLGKLISELIYKGEPPMLLKEFSLKRNFKSIEAMR
jgi:sarcosine oxidase subunit beta